MKGNKIMDIFVYIIIGLILHFIVVRPIEKYKAREYCKNKGLVKDLPKLKLYEWWL